MGSNSGHPKRLLLVSEPKIQCHHEEALGARSPPSYPEMQVPSLGAYWLRGEGELSGTHFSPAA